LCEDTRTYKPYNFPNHSCVDIKSHRLGRSEKWAYGERTIVRNNDIQQPVCMTSYPRIQKSW